MKFKMHDVLKHKTLDYDIKITRVSKVKEEYGYVFIPGFSEFRKDKDSIEKYWRKMTKLERALK